jgi:hypothetical protein
MINPWDVAPGTWDSTHSPWVTTTRHTGTAPQHTVAIHNTQNVILDEHGVCDSLIAEKDLQKDVFSVPVERLVNLWITRFGNDWVNLESIDNDDFFKTAYKRLKQLGELEVHYLTDRARYVCRIPQ